MVDKALTRCIVCGTDELEFVVSLGNHYLADFVDAVIPDVPTAPLTLHRCHECSLLQLGYMVDRDRLFRRYHYRSAINQTMRNHLRAIAEGTDLKKGDVVVDIGANDGTFLSFLPGNVTKVAFEPAQSVQDELRGVADVVHEDYFSLVPELRNKVKLVTSFAMFYDLEHPGEFAADVKAILAPQGLWLLEMNHAGTLIGKTAFDFIGHEHLAVYFLSSLNRVVRPVGLEVVDVRSTEINGGSFRVTIVHKGAFLTKTTVDEFLLGEVEYRTQEAAQKFAIRAHMIMRELHQLATDIKGRGQTLYIKGASTRGMTILQAADLDSTLVVAAMDINPEKHGKFIAGLNIPIKSLEEARLDKPDYILSLPWAYKESFLEQERDLMAQGTKMIFPIPQVETVYG